MIEIIKNTNIDFLGMRRVTLVISIVLVSIGLVTVVQIARGKANLGIDFAGGTAVQLKFDKPIAIDDAREILSNSGFPDAELQEITQGNKLLIRVKKETTIEEKVATRIVGVFRKEMTDNEFVIDSSTEIGPTVGLKLQKDALVAILVSMIGIIIYIAMRFEFRFGLAAAVATLHDVLAVLGIFFILDREITLLTVTALLTLAGYSLTDTVGQNNSSDAWKSQSVINEPIAGGQAQISGRFSTEEASDLAIILRAGALPAPVKIIQNLTVGPSLGRDSIEKGMRATVIAGILVIIFMIAYYRLSGVIANVALIMNLTVLVGSLAVLNATLTLPGIAGIILTIGMGVDSNVLIFERIREELRSGKPIRLSVDSGYDKALVTIIDSHVTTLITAVVLFLFGTGPIKGFAVTLSLGIMINLFTALVGTKVVFDFINGRWKVKRLSI